MSQLRTRGERNVECSIMNGESLWGRGRDERDWRETRDAELVFLVYLVNFVHRTRETK